MSRRLSTATLFRGSSYVAMAMTLFIGVALPVVAPFMAGHASAQQGSTVRMIYGNPTGNPVIQRVQWSDRDNRHGEAWDQGAECAARYTQVTVDNALVERAL